MLLASSIGVPASASLIFVTVLTRTTDKVSPQPMPCRVALVTDSTACIPAALAAQWGVGVVPIQIRIGQHVDHEHRMPKRLLIEALQQHLAVTTDAPAPAAFHWAYGEAIARGADEVVSVHISSGQSQTYQRALAAAAQSPVPVHVIDSRTTGMSLGYAVLAAARVAGAGGGPRRVLDALVRRLDGSRELIYVDTLEYLRRGGRIGAAAAAMGSALSVKPLLTMVDGRVTPVDRALGSERALRRLVDTAARWADDRPVDVAVEHFGAAARANRVLDRLGPRLRDAREITLTEVSSAIGIHVGPGAVGISISPAA
jgi:DegV family protein with EDD domain